MNGLYDDMINLPHHVSKTRRQMPISNRAAQFSLLAALIGYDDAIKETARITDTQIELSESVIADLDKKLGVLVDAAADHQEITEVYFQADGKKDDGSYVTITGALKKIDDECPYRRKKIEIVPITDTECDFLKSYCKY